MMKWILSPFSGLRTAKWKGPKPQATYWNNLRTKEGRILKALADCYDTGNILQESWDQLMTDGDAFEFENALMDLPEDTAAIDEFMLALRQIYVAKVIAELDRVENDYPFGG